MRIALDRPQNLRAMQSTPPIAQGAEVKSRVQAPEHIEDRARPPIQAQAVRQSSTSESRSVTAAQSHEPKESAVGFKWPEGISQTLTEVISERNLRLTEDAIRAYTDQNQSLETWQFSHSDTETNELGRFSANSLVSSASGGAIAGVGSIIDMRV